MAWALGIAAAYMAAEFIGGLLANSLALLADAGRMATDVAALGLSLWAMRLAEKPATEERTYGYHRAEILAALANGATLVAISAYIFFEAYRRLLDPPDVVGPTMLAVATGGLIVNGIGVWLLHAGRKENLNVQGAWLHVVGDTLGSIGAIGGAVMVWAFGWRRADPIAGALIGVLILYSSWNLLKESVNVLMASTPKGLDVPSIRSALCGVEGVTGVHDLHVWTLTSGVPLLTAHVDLGESVDPQRVLQKLEGIARGKFGIAHSTFQIEAAGGEGCEPSL
ncbi:MAG: cation diffusion facilitator family transporter [Gemmatimonadota bacterium]